MTIRIQGTVIINNETAYIDLAGQSAVKVPVGNIAQRPTGVIGQLRFNTETQSFEGFNGTEWAAVGGSDELALTLATIALG